MSYLILYEVVRHETPSGKIVWRVQKKMKPPFLGTYEVFNRLKDAKAHCLGLNNKFNKACNTPSNGHPVD